MRIFEIYVDGAAKGNPGHAGIGAIICREDKVLKNISTYIGETTNNVAEYTALIFALKEALVLKAESLKIFTDSELMYRQIKKEYKVKHPNLIGLYSEVISLLKLFKDFQINHVPREKNVGADKLANLAVKEYLKKN